MVAIPAAIFIPTVMENHHDREEEDDGDCRRKG